MAKWEIKSMERNSLEGGITATFEYNGDDLRKINLSSLDHKLLEECEKSDKASDKLLALEMLFRRMEENNVPMKEVSSC